LATLQLIYFKTNRAARAVSWATRALPGLARARLRACQDGRFI